jgi:pyruvate kinase
MDAVAYTAYKTAERTGAQALVCITVAGNTALKTIFVSSPHSNYCCNFFPRHLESPAFGAWSQRHCFGHGAPISMRYLPIVNDRLIRDSWLKAGDTIIFVSITISSVERENSNLFTIQKLH